MTSERMQRQIDAILDQAESAVGSGDWQAVQALAARVLAIDATNADALAFLAMAGAAPHGDEPAAPAPAPSVRPAAVAAQPASFVGGRYHVRRFLGEGGKKKVFLAHDALLDRGIHLVTTSDTEASKLRQLQRLRSLDADWKTWTPLFVTEGTADAKMLSIARVDYLRWVRERLENTAGNFVVFGHRLDADADAHLAQALIKGDDSARLIAVSIHDPSGMSGPQKAERWAELLHSLPSYAGRLLLFDAATHPLYKLLKPPRRWLIESSLSWGRLRANGRARVIPPGYPVLASSADDASYRDPGFRWQRDIKPPTSITGTEGRAWRQIRVGDNWYRERTVS